MTAPASKPATRHKILLLDDEQDVLDLYREIFSQLSSKPEIHTATSGARALALLEGEAFSVLISDLKMPKMDGLQVLAIVRRKFPQLRTVVLTSIADEQFRARAYSMGVDLYLDKPSSSKEIAFMLDCIESLLGQENSGGFRGVQSKSLVDLVQLESLSQSSSVLRILNGKVEGKIWIQNGDVIDAATDELNGEEAFRRILAWKTGTFEILPPDASHPRKIFTSCQGLLLDSAQALDEAQAGPAGGEGSGESRLAQLGGIPGVEFVVRLPAESNAAVEHWGLDNPEDIAAWSRDLLKTFQRLDDRFQLGKFDGFEAKGPQQGIQIITAGNDHLVLGMKRLLTKEQEQTILKRISERWAS